MASFTILVTSSPLSEQNAYSAYRFAEAVIASEHSINGIFFYESGTLAGSALQITPADEFDLHKAWIKLSKENTVPLMVCVSAATKRGITNQQDAIDSDQAHFSLSNDFDSVGLGELAVLMNSSDRVVQF